MTTILLGAGASVPFFEPKLDTNILTHAIANRNNWQEVINKYNGILCDEGYHREIPTLDEIMCIIDYIVSKHSNYNFEQIAEVIDKYCSIMIDTGNKTMLSSILDFLDIQNLYKGAKTDIRWGEVPFLFREIIANTIIKIQNNSKASNYGELQVKQDNFLKYICVNDTNVTIVSLNYDDCIIKSARLNDFNFCFTFKDDKGFIQDVPSVIQSKRTIIFPHGHLRLCPLNNGTVNYYHDANIADEWRWNQLFDTISNGTSTYTPSSFAYNFNTFITTGQTKDDSLNYEPFSAYYQRMAKDLIESDRIIIIGYAFSDEHINRFLKSFLYSNPNNKVLVVDYEEENITMIDEYKKPDHIITKLYKVFSPQWPILVDNEGNKNPMDKKQVEQLNTMGYGEIFDNVLFYKEGYEVFLNNYLQVLRCLYTPQKISLWKRIRHWFNRAFYAIKKAFDS